MKLPLNIIARFLLKRVVVPSLVNAVADKNTSFDLKDVKHAAGDAILAEVTKQLAKKMQ